MKNRITDRGKVSLFVLFATLFALVAALLPTVASADPAAECEIEDFCYQTVIGADVKDSASTDLRFLFSVGTLSYDAVGFVFSTSNDPVKTDEPKANYTTTTTVYGSVTANGKQIPAPAAATAKRADSAASSRKTSAPRSPTRWKGGATNRGIAPKRRSTESSASSERSATEKRIIPVKKTTTRAGTFTTRSTYSGTRRWRIAPATN